MPNGTKQKEGNPNVKPCQRFIFTKYLGVAFQMTLPPIFEI